jgi:hypothetical protein
MMADDQDEARTKQIDFIVRRLAAEAGVTEAQARDLVAVLGLNWASLVREARILKKNP